MTTVVLQPFLLHMLLSVITTHLSYMVRVLLPMDSGLFPRPPLHARPSPFPCPPPPPPSPAASLVRYPVAFYHATMGSPPLSTWCAAIDDGFLITWPDLTSAQVRWHQPFSVAMVQGHLDQQRANLRSTQPDPVALDTPAPLSPPTTGPATVRTRNIFVDCQLVTGQIATDLPGRFLVSSSRGNSYVLIVYDYDSNYIHAEPLRSRAGADILAGYK